MALLKNILGFRDFSKIEEIKQHINHHLFYDQREDIEFAQELLFFETARQKSWLIATNLRLFCILDDTAKDNFNVRWDLKKHELLLGREFVLKLKIDPDYKAKSGLIHFGEKHKNWLYSKSLFPTASKLKRSVEQLVVTQMSS